MKNLKSFIFSLFIGSLMMFAVGCSDSYEEGMQSFDSQAAFEANDNDMSNVAKAKKAKMYTAELTMLNESGVSGTAEITLTGNELTVKIHATGLEPGMIHPQHIHGFMETKKNATCPPPSADTNGDGLIDLGEGLPFYGPILQPLYVPIDTYPFAENGTIDYERTFILGETEFEEEGEVATYSELNPLQNRVIVLHGLTVNGEYIATLPIACGQITSSQGK